ncbi:hypothetical protein B0H12DRAFT_301891 [Mycena haematopus]|nr:hypothetical protein B0H12DRAFT_301891 [Mycena haematopus]
MPHHSEQDHSEHDDEQDQDRIVPDEDADEDSPEARRTTPPVLFALGTHVAVPATPTRRVSVVRRESFARVDPDVELLQVDDLVGDEVHVRNIDGEGGDVEGDVAEGDVEGEVEGGVDADGDDTSDGEDSEAALLGLVKITSADPRAAARAAAILKQHDYDCFTRLRAGINGKGKGRRHSYAGVSNSYAGVSKPSPSGRKSQTPGRMRDIEELRGAYSAESKSRSRSRHAERGEREEMREKNQEETKEKNRPRASTPTPARPRASTPTPARVVGDRVYFPGSPAPVTTEELLAEAEREVVASTLGRRDGQSTSARKDGQSTSASVSASPSARQRQAMDKETDKMRRTSARGVPLPESDDEDAAAQGEDDSGNDRGKEAEGKGREWTKAEWKMLDACFTDERIAVAAKLGMVLNLSPSPRLVPGHVNSANGAGGTGTTAVVMASADAVDLGAVVGRFVKLMGGERVVQGRGASWELDRLTQYARALQNKQRAGHVAPPTPSVAKNTNANDDGGGSSSVFTSERRRASVVVPDFTPLGRRAMPARFSGGGRTMPALALDSDGSPSPHGNTESASRAVLSRARLPPPVSAGAPFSNLPPTPEPARRRRVPGSLLAPRYSHLLEEAVTVSKGRVPEEEKEAAGNGDEDEEAAGNGDEDVSFTDGEEQERDTQEEQDSSFDSSVDGEDADMAPATPLREREARLQHTAPQPPATIGNRVKGFISSYLPMLSKTAPPPTRRPPLHAGPRLPLPPLELLEKPRGPVTTPVRPPLPKTRAPKELVNLNPAPPPKPKSFLPRRAPPPKRLVELQHIEPPVEEPRVVPFTRPRTASGGSVKDLVKNFESKTQSATSAGAQVKRVRSVGEFGGVGGGNNKRFGTAGGAARPMWRP